MLIKSMAGDFNVSIDKFEIEQGQLVMVGKMGVWEARTYLTPHDVLGFVGKLLSPSVLLYVLRLPYLLIRVKPKKRPASNGGEDE